MGRKIHRIKIRIPLWCYYYGSKIPKGEEIITVESVGALQQELKHIIKKFNKELGIKLLT